MRMVVIGKTGQLSRELVEILGTNTVCLGRGDTDITNEAILFDTLNGLTPDVVINASAYTEVDKAENEEEYCHLVNATAVANLARYCKSNGIFLVHVSSDYVFNGHKGIPYRQNDLIEPQSVYGKSKAAGENALLKILPNSSCIIRTAWVYSVHGNNFVKTMLRLMREKSYLSVIDDQIGTPTWAKGLASACIFAAESKTPGVFHWTDEGVASWYDFATAIQDLALEKGLLENAIPILPTPSSEYPTPAKRPFYSVLDKTESRKVFQSCNPCHWRKQLGSMLDELKA